MITIEKKTYEPLSEKGVRSTFYDLRDGDTKIGGLSIFETNVGEHPYTDKEDKDILYLSSFLVYPEYRRKGYARQLLRKVKEEYKGKVIVLHAQSFGPLLQEDLTNFYASEGFKFTSDEEKNKPEGSKQKMFIEL